MFFKKKFEFKIAGLSCVTDDEEFANEMNNFNDAFDPDKQMHKMKKDFCLYALWFVAFIGVIALGTHLIDRGTIANNSFYSGIGLPLLIVGILISTFSLAKLNLLWSGMREIGAKKSQATGYEPPDEKEAIDIAWNYVIENSIDNPSF